MKIQALKFNSVQPLRWLVSWCLGLWIKIGCIGILAILWLSPGFADDDYFDQITVFSEGRITRFVEMPITVYISPVLQTKGYLLALRDAMRQWEETSDGKIWFQESPVSEGADIVVGWTSSALMRIIDTPLGKTSFTRLNDTQFRVNITLIHPESILSRAQMTTACLHELGHAIGLWGHSPNPLDVSFAASTAQGPTAGDRATLLKVYATPPNMPQHEVAIGVLKKQLERKLQRIHTHYLLGTVYLDKGNINTAIEHFKTALSLDTSFEQAREQLLNAYQTSNRIPEAIELLHQMLNQTPSVDVYNTLGVMHYQNASLKKAVESLQKALELHPNHPVAKKNLHQIFREQGISATNARKFDEAIRYFQKALQFNPDDPLSHRLMGNCYARNGDLKNTIAQYQKARQFDPVNRKIKENLASHWSNYGVQLTKAQRWGEAIAAYQQALELMPTLSVAKKNLIAALWQQAEAQRTAGNITPAISTYHEILKFEGNSADAHSRLGELYLKKWAYAQAVSAFQSARDAEPNNKQVLHNLFAAHHHYAQHLEQQNQYDAAAAQLRLALQLTPTDLTMRLRLANLYQRAGHSERAQAEFARILKDDPHNSAAINYRVARGTTLMNMGRYTEALTEFNAIEAGAKSVEIYNTIGYLYMKENEPLSAIKAFESALSKRPLDRVAYQNLRAIESQFIAKFTVNQKSSQHRNGLGRIYNSLVRCYIGRNEYTNASATYRKAVDLFSGFPVASDEASLLPAPAIQAELIKTGIRLALTFQSTGQTEHKKKVLRSVQKLDADHPTVKKLLGNKE